MNNESSEIMRMFDLCFNDMAKYPDKILESDAYEGNWGDYEAKRPTCNKYYKYRMM